MTFKADMRDLRFQLFEWLDTEELLKTETFSQWEKSDIDMVLGEAETIAVEKLAPSNRDADRIGARWDAGQVTMPPSMHEAYKTLCEGGWTSNVDNPAFGGMGLPETVGSVINEVFFGANSALTLAMILTRGAARIIDRNGSEELRATYCQRMFSGEWSGTMCMTESQSGSDVGAIKTRATKLPNGNYSIQGEKIFISSGEHDLTPNIIHLLLARTPDSPVGTSGLSLFCVPKIRVSGDGALAEPNGITCSRIEEKMGLHGSPTCVLVFGGSQSCEGVLLGEERQGIKLMFQMMNAARIEVGLQGSSLAAAAFQEALDYSRTRLQTRHWSKSRDHSAPPVPIIEHPDVRRMLLTASAYVQAMRALLLQTSYYLDMSAAAPEEQRARFQSYVDVLTPICKTLGSDWGYEVTERCMQILGGYGYTCEYPMEQYMRDAKVTSIYEGTNGIQALDLVTRKLMGKNSGASRELLAITRKTAQDLASDQELGASANLLIAAITQIEETLDEIAKHTEGTLLAILNAVPLLEMTGEVLTSGYLLHQASVAQAKLKRILENAGLTITDSLDRRAAVLSLGGDAAFYHDKIQNALHFAFTTLPHVGARTVAIKTGQLSPMQAIF